MTATVVLMSDIKVLLTVVIVLMAAIIVPMSSNYSSNDGWSTTAATGLGHRTIDRNGQIRTQERSSEGDERKEHQEKQRLDKGQEGTSPAEGEGGEGRLQVHRQEEEGPLLSWTMFCSQCAST